MHLPQHVMLTAGQVTLSTNPAHIFRCNTQAPDSIWELTAARSQHGMQHMRRQCGAAPLTAHIWGGCCTAAVRTQLLLRPVLLQPCAHLPMLLPDAHNIWYLSRIHSVLYCYTTGWKDSVGMTADDDHPIILVYTSASAVRLPAQNTHISSRDNNREYATTTTTGA